MEIFNPTWFKAFLKNTSSAKYHIPGHCFIFFSLLHSKHLHGTYCVPGTVLSAEKPFTLSSYIQKRQKTNYNYNNKIICNILIYVK